MILNIMDDSSDSSEENMRLKPVEAKITAIITINKETLDNK